MGSSKKKAKILAAKMMLDKLDGREEDLMSRGTSHGPVEHEATLTIPGKMKPCFNTKSQPVHSWVDKIGEALLTFSS